MPDNASGLCSNQQVNCVKLGFVSKGSTCLHVTVNGSYFSKHLLLSICILANQPFNFPKNEHVSPVSHMLGSISLPSISLSGKFGFIAILRFMFPTAKGCLISVCM